MITVPDRKLVLFEDNGALRFPFRETLES